MFVRRLKVDMETQTRNIRSMYRMICGLALVATCVCPSLLSQHSHEPRRVHDFADLDAIIQDAVDRGNTPGAVVLIGHDGHIVYRRAFGFRSLEPTRERMTLGTVFDLASLT